MKSDNLQLFEPINILGYFSFLSCFSNQCIVSYSFIILKLFTSIHYYGKDVTMNFGKGESYKNKFFLAPFLFILTPV